MEAGGPLSPRFCPRLIRHTKGLMESEEKLCVKVLRTLQQMLLKKSKYGDRVSVTRHSWARAGAREAGPCSPKASPYPPRATSCGRCSCRITSRTASPAPGASSLTPQALVSATAPPFPALHGWLLLQTAVSHMWLLPTSNRCLSHAASPQGLDQDWSAIAATQCRLDKEGATKLVCDLITSTKNEKIFQESIGLAIRLLDGGNTEIQVWGSEPRSSCLLGRSCGAGGGPAGHPPAGWGQH